MKDPGPTAELAIPKTRASVAGAIVLATFILFFVVVAMHNLVDGSGLIASILWLLLVGAVAAGMCKEQGIRRFLVNLLGAYALRQFVRALPKVTGATEIQFGYRLFGFRFVYFGVSVDRIESVEWHTGQASEMGGRDMDDWHVALWFDHGDPVKSQRHQHSRKPDQDVHIVGPSRSKDLTVAFGHSVLEFVRKAGADLVQGEDEYTFVRPRSGPRPTGKLMTEY